MIMTDTMMMMMMRRMMKMSVKLFVFLYKEE